MSALPSPESLPTYELADENPRVAALLGSAGLTAVDLQLFYNLRQHGASIFTHCSLIKNRITKSSDIDFTVMTKIEDMPVNLQDTLMVGHAAASESYSIDYTSTSIRSQADRKISLHISEPAFRDSYPDIDRPYATEYRPGTHAKAGPRKYLLAATNQSGSVRLINFLCNSQPIGSEGATVTDIPQTGQILLEENSVIMNGEKHQAIEAAEIIRIKPNGDTSDKTKGISEEVMVLGLEFDKMQSDTSLFMDPELEDRFVVQPTIRSMDRLAEFSSTDPQVITSRIFAELANHWSKFKPGKSR